MTAGSGQPVSAVRETVHRGDDDLLTAGLGVAGLLDPRLPPAVDDARPTPAEQRRRAVHSNWRGIADLSHTAAAEAIRPVAGREFHARLQLPGRRHGHRVMLQLPDDFDGDLRCLLVTAASGSRGIYGALAVAAAWGLPRGCAVVTTDKGGGCDWFDVASGDGFTLDGSVTGDPAQQVFRPARVPPAMPAVAIAHAHSGDNPEADWGLHLRQAAEFGLVQLQQAMPSLGRCGFDTIRVIAVGISNAGAAVLRAAADPQPWLSGAVAASPNVHPPRGGRPLFDYATEAAIWMDAAHASPELADAPLPLPLLPATTVERRREAAVDALQAAGLLPAGPIAHAASTACRRLREAGWSDPALHAASLTSAFDMWRAVGVAYSSAHGRFAVDAHPCGHRYAMLDEAGLARPPNAAERALWWSDGAGIVPGAGVEIIDPPHVERLASLLALRALWLSRSPAAVRVRDGIAATRAGLPRPGLPLLLLHGSDDGLIPEAFSSLPYVAACRAAGRDVHYWPIAAAQHFDAFLGLPQFGARYRPLLPALHAGLDAMLEHLLHGRALRVGDAGGR